MPTKKSALDQVRGFIIRAIKAGIKKSGNLDLGLIYGEREVVGAGVFTQNNVAAAPVILSREFLQQRKGKVRGVLVNAGNANACTGKRGLALATQWVKQVASGLHCTPEEILLCSTGVIGQQLDAQIMFRGIDRLLAGEGGAGADFTQAILTTDLVEKTAAVVLKNGVRIAGVCKGSGMIAPKMGTLLAFVLTDAKINYSLLQKMLREIAALTFNCVSVDGDTSTNDTLLVLASGARGEKITSAKSANYREFYRGLLTVCQALAEQVARDGEGATKLIRLKVNGAKNDELANIAARAVAQSPLVKTAMFGNDPNWGRIICALGYSGTPMNAEKTTIALCGKTIFRRGTPQKFNADELSKKMRAPEVIIKIELGMGQGRAEFLTCDFSYDYVKINADYHT